MKTPQTTITGLTARTLIGTAVCLLFVVCGAFSADYGLISSKYVYPNAVALGGVDQNAFLDLWSNTVFAWDNYESVMQGSSALEVQVANSWFGFGVRSDKDKDKVDDAALDSVNMSAYSGGYIKFWIKSEVAVKLGVITWVPGGSQVNRTVNLASYGLVLNNSWQQISVPFSAFTGINMSYVYLYCYFGEVTNVSTNINKKFSIDDVRYSTLNYGNPSKISILPGVGHLKPGTAQTFKAFGYDSNGDLVVKAFNWSVSPAIAAVNPASSSATVVTANLLGQGNLTANFLSVSKNIPLTINTSTTILAKNLYNDQGIPAGNLVRVFPDPLTQGGPTLSEITDSDLPVISAVPEGRKCWKIDMGSVGWGGLYLEAPAPVDLSKFGSGSLKFNIYFYTPTVTGGCDVVVKMKAASISNPSIYMESAEKFVSLYDGRDGTYPNYLEMSGGTFSQVSIPMSAFAFDDLDLSSTTLSFIISSAGTSLSANNIIYLDNIRIESEIAQPLNTPVRVSGYQLMVNGGAFTVKGVNYSPMPVGYNYSYDWASHPEIYKTDFNLIKMMGANTVRFFQDPYEGKTLPSYPVLDELANQGLYAIMGYWFEPTSDLNNPDVANAIKSGFINVVRKYKYHPAVLYWVLGNEVGVSLSPAQKSTMYNFINNCVTEAHLEEGETFHPVSTAIADVNDLVNFNVPNIDLWSVNMYLGSTFLTRFTEYAGLSSKCMVVTEFGCDAYDSKLQVEDESTQSAYLTTQWNAIASNLSAVNPLKVCAGGCVFEWVDEWWKYQYGDVSVHDTAGSFRNPLYSYDDISGENNIQEEWWGIAKTAINPLGYREIRQAYNTLSGLWRTTPAVNFSLLNVSNNLPSANISWDAVLPSSWKVANQYVKIEADPGCLAWGIQIYTDNVNGTPPYPADPDDLDKVKNPSGLVSSTSNSVLPLCWKISDNLLTAPVAVPDQRFDAATNSYYFENGYLWVKDVNTTDDPSTPFEDRFINGDFYVTAWNNDGIQYGGRVDERGLALSPNYLYIGADFTRATTPNTYSSKIYLDFFVP